MSRFKQIVILLLALVFGTFFLLAVSFVVRAYSSRTVSSDTLGEHFSFTVNQEEAVDLTVELGKVTIVETDNEQLTVEYRYPAADYLDNQIKVIGDRDETGFHLRINSKRKMYFFGLVRDKACAITIGIPKGLYPDFSVKMQAGTLTFDGPQFRSLYIDGDLAEIEVRSLGTAALEKTEIYNNIGNVAVYLENLPESTHKSLIATVNIGTIDLHLDTRENRGYRLDYVYNIGRLTMKGERKGGFGQSGSYTAGEKIYAAYQLKTDVGGIRIYENKADTQ